MICLSKADEDHYRRSTWNQSPPPLAPQHTTRQDMNGISNLREIVDAGVEGGSGGGGLYDAAMAGDTGGGSPDDESIDDDASARKAKLICEDFSLLCKAGPGGGGQPCPFPLTNAVNLAIVWSWSTWVMSVLATSLILNNLPVILSFFHALGAADQPTVLASTQQEQPPSPTVRVGKRASTCASGGVHDEDAYNTPLHAGAVVIVWFVSTLACVFPILAKKVPGLRIPTRFFFAVRHFGTGVLIATAFVHLLPTAFVSLGNPCLGDFWTTDYNAMPGAIALAAIFFVTIIEMVFHPSRHLPPTSATPENDVEIPPTTEPIPLRRTRSESTALPLRGMAPLHGSTSNMGYGLTHLQLIEGEAVMPVRSSPVETRDAGGYKIYQSSVGGSSSSLNAQKDLKLKKERLQCILLEVGILFHSVFIGMALSVSVGSDFVVLLIAIVFHQTFEGLALGSRIASVTWGSKVKQPWMMACAYGCTTPIGQAIGLATSSLYSPDSEVGLILVGVMNAISAGLLTYASLVELLSEDFLSDESWRILRGKRRVFACLLVFFGAFFMSLVGAWA